VFISDKEIPGAGTSLTKKISNRISSLPNSKGTVAYRISLVTDLFCLNKKHI
jgi:hypothetical protein